jgi:hypothetical protein
VEVIASVRRMWTKSLVMTRLKVLRLKVTRSLVSYAGNIVKLRESSEAKSTKCASKGSHGQANHLGMVTMTWIEQSAPKP